ncbi:MAG TPA: YdcF family protein [Mucilaginibacter sp.]|nr:YdcF family protein [Mucilaginibacter sp.]
MLSKLLLIFIFPFTWILIFLLAAAFLRKPKLKRRFFFAALIILLIFSSPFLLNQFARLWDVQPEPLKKKSYSCAIVLGGFSSVDGNGKGYFNPAADRFIEGLKLISTGKATHLLITGGSGSLLNQRFKESVWVKTQLELVNVPDSCIIIEDQSRNTFENAIFSKRELDKHQLSPPYLLVTSAFHMRRSLRIFRKHQVDVIPYPCNFLEGRGNFMASDLIPSADPLSTWNIYIKEVVGSVAYYFK